MPRTAAEIGEAGWMIGNEALTGRIYAIPQENVLATDSGTVYVDVPCYDSPSVLTERHVVIK